MYQVYVGILGERNDRSPSDILATFFENMPHRKPRNEARFFFS